VTLWVSRGKLELGPCGGANDMESLLDVTLRLAGFLMGIFIVSVLIAAVFNVGAYALLVVTVKALLP